MDKKIIIGQETNYPLNGILSLPDIASAKVPAVVLVHGSGPADMDESIGANKPFRDIAEALSAQGIAVLRYDKRTKIYGKQLFTGVDLICRAAFGLQYRNISPCRWFGQYGLHLKTVCFGGIKRLTYSPL